MWKLASKITGCIMPHNLSTNAQERTQTHTQYKLVTSLHSSYCIGLVTFLFLSDTSIAEISLSIHWQMNVHELRCTAKWWLQVATICHTFSARIAAHVLIAAHGYALASSSKVKAYGACIPGSASSTATIASHWNEVWGNVHIHCRTVISMDGGARVETGPAREPTARG